MEIKEIKELLAVKMKKEQIITNAPMKEYTSFKAGGNVWLLVKPKNFIELQYTMSVIINSGIDYYIMGNGTNILVRDGGYHGVIVKIGQCLSSIKVSDNRIEAEAGALLKNVSQAALEHKLTGFEFASGIPGSIGGASYMNAGAYDSDMSTVINSVKILKAETGEIIEYSAADMEYAYRSSKLMKEKGIILSVLLKLNEGNEKEIAHKMEDFNKRRNEKQPLNYPSGGSFFKRPPGNYAGTLIQQAGLKGMKIGGAKVSELHAGFLINEDNASASDILELMNYVREKVFDYSGILLEPEIRIIGDEGQ